jgi:hypothetical protein
MNYPTTIRKYSGTIAELAEDIGRLRYDINLELNSELLRVYRKQAQDDQKASHPRLAKLLKEYAEIQKQAQEKMSEIFKICENKLCMRNLR